MRDWKFYRVLLFLLCVAPLLQGADDQKAKLPPQFGPLHILEVGLNGEFSAYAPTSVRVHIANPQTVRLQVELRVQPSYRDGNRYPFVKQDSFSRQLALEPNEQREVEIPVLLPLLNDAILGVTASTTNGAVFAYDRFAGDRQLSPRNIQGSVGLLCATEQSCKQVQEQAMFSGTMEDRVEKNKTLHFINIATPRNHWWPYSVLSSLVVTAPMQAYTREQRDAIEDFVRRGARLVLLEKEIADPSFFKEYRQGAPPTNAIRVGRGSLYRIASLDSQTLGDVFSGRRLTQLINAPQMQTYQYSPLPEGEAMRWLGKHAATQFTFPRLRWLLIWMSVYIVVIGLVNFTILKRLRRLEWGWLTVLAGALLFSAGFYISSSSDRPKRFTLDRLAVYWMDQHSAKAFGNYDLRVSAPERETLRLTVPDATMVLAASYQRSSNNAHIGAQIRERGVTPPVNFGVEPVQVDVPLLRWSFEDYSLQGPRELKGTLHEVGTGRLRNDTGLALSDVMYVDYDLKRTWLLGAMAPGAEISLSDDASLPFTLDEQAKARLRARIARGAYELRELALSTGVEHLSRRVALAVSRESMINAGLSPMTYTENDRALLVVGLQ